MVSGSENKSLEALQDPDVQCLAWEQHGFRSGVQGIQQELSALQVAGLPASINAVLPMPSAAVMQLVRETLAAQP